LNSIRKATRTDATLLAGLAERTFRETFGASNTAQDMDAHCRSHFGESIQADEIACPNMLTLLAEREGELAGFAQLRWSAAPGFVAGRCPGEIHRLYVRSQLHGTGIAQRLMAACIEAMTGRGSDVIWLGVWERNPRAMAFYRKFGFVERGSHVFSLGGDPQRDIVMVRHI
jgi:diamine N-acetyltransferase